MRENKEDICCQLFEAIRRTRAGDDVVGLRYVKEGYEEYVYVDFIDNPGGRKNNVSMDYGIAMIRDVINNIDIG